MSSPAPATTSAPSLVFLTYTYMERLRSRISALAKEAGVFLAWTSPSADSLRWPRLDAPGADLECGVKSGKRMHPIVVWYSIAYIFRQLLSIDGFPFVIIPPASNASPAKRLQSPVHRQQNVKQEDKAASFVDLATVKIGHRIKSISCGQKHVPKLCRHLPTQRYKPRLRLTGDQLSNYLYPPEPRGEDFRKWILVMETFYPNRGLWVREHQQNQDNAALQEDQGQKTSVHSVRGVSIRLTSD